MTVQVKICGIGTESALSAAIEAGADYAGFVFFPKSPRHIDLATAGELAAIARGRIRTVALLVDATDAELDDILSTVDPDLVQLHGSETPERVAEIRVRAARPVLKAVKVATAADIVAASAFPAADMFLFDAKPARNAALPGGNGVPFDWPLLAQTPPDRPFMLSGGLTADNIAEAIRLTGALAVDTSSGVERAPGQKDPAAIRRFVEAARAAGQRLPIQAA
ncbi:MAG: phosphoribosylanthranilate isomerase [Dichotomicrobium sp.]